MKLIVAIMEDQLSGEVIKGLTEEGRRATVLSSTGGLLRSGKATLLIGVEDEDVDPAVNTIREKLGNKKVAKGKEALDGVDLIILDMQGYHKI
ncbi:MAG: hypothetical protein GX080_01530 [Tissierellia bacterium]|nr:hypothetical protein [Tissierellia bacterium]